jgi:long-chain acyl-CoA synthetase
MKRIWLGSYESNTPADVKVDRFQSLVEVFEESARKYADRPAFNNLGRTLTFAELEGLSRAFAAYLQERGLAKGDRIALMMPNLLQYPVALFGALRAGLVVVNTNPQYTPRELKHQLCDSGASVVVVLANFAHVLQQVLPETSVRNVIVTEIGDLLTQPRRAAVNFVVRRLRHMVPNFRIDGAVSFREALERGRKVELRAPGITARDLSFLQYTGGTTGVPKGAMLSHGNVVANLEQVSAFWSSLIDDGRDIVITPLPMYHIFCLTCNCLTFMKHGGLNVLITNPRDIAATLAEMRKWQFSIITGVNTLYRGLLNHSNFSSLDFSRLKLGVAGGMPLHPEIARRWHEATGRQLLEGYGLTEASPVVACNPPHGEYDGTIGTPVPSTDISIREGELEVDIGQHGELCVRGPQVMVGYWNRPEDTAKTITADGWLHTGDVAVIDERGRLRIVDRIKDMIIVSGFKVFPNEIDGVLEAHPDIAEAAAVGVADERTGQAVKIFVVPRAGARLTAEQVIEHCKANLAPYKVPRYVEFRESLPKTNIGKVLRRALVTETRAAA